MFPLLKPFDGFRYHLAGPLGWSSDTLCKVGVSDLQEKKIFGSQPFTRKMQLPIAAVMWGIELRQFRLLSNYFCLCCVQVDLASGLAFEQAYYAQVCTSFIYIAIKKLLNT